MSTSNIQFTNIKLDLIGQSVDRQNHKNSIRKTISNCKDNERGNHVDWLITSLSKNEDNPLYY